MSVTFQCPDAPRRQVPCQFCQEAWADFPEGNGLGGKCDRFCTGTTEESSAPEVNFANGNAIGILALLGWTDSEDYLGGSCDAVTMRRRIMRARNTDRSDLVVEPSETPGGHAGTQVIEGEDGLPTIQRMGASTISFGNTDEQTLRRLASLEALAIWAQENGLEISWG